MWHFFHLIFNFIRKAATCLHPYIPACAGWLVVGKVISMEPIYVIQNGLGCQEDSLKVYPDRVLIQKPKENTHSMMGVIKKELRLQGIIKSEYIGIDVRFSEISNIYFRPATSEILKNGLLVFYLKGRGRNEVTAFNYGKTANAIKFWSQDNDTAKRIKEYVERGV